MKNIFSIVFLLSSCVCFSQKPDTTQSEGWKKIYRASAAKINDLVHTKLDVSFDYSRSWMYGKAWITLHSHFYAVDSLNLDAKGMTINEVSMMKTGKPVPLKYVYDGLNLRIILDKTYSAAENYTVFIDYISKPEEIRINGSKPMSDRKGLYFINPLGKEKNKPTQIWTQGETEFNSVWFPTIDKPNQKTTDEISMTVPDIYQTLSNGILISHKKHSNRTRTDTWKMDLPHAPYLMMIAVGEYSIIKDRYKGKEVSYYVEKEYAPVARKIFGYTPEMIDYFSRITGVDYPWAKYAQIVVRGYSGAMETTTATLHDEYAQQDKRQLIDENFWETIIAHELFHQWFGNYVTNESWSNLSLNESFADFSESLWTEYKHGKDAGDELSYNKMYDYLLYGSPEKDLVRFYYKEQEQMFDAISYQKGGCVLNMLRNYVGDSAFYKSLNLYLTTKKFQPAEAHDLRLAFEEVTGQDLNWFWNQWYFGSGHPKLEISYDYDKAGKTAKVFIKQNQTDKLFRFLIAVDVYQGAEKKRYKVWVDQKADTLSFPAASKPDLINVDADKILLCEKTDHKTLDNYIFQYENAKLYVDRREAVDFAAENQAKDTKALDLLIIALNDKYQGLKIHTIQQLKVQNDTIKYEVEPLLTSIAQNDPKSLIRAAAIKALGKYKKDTYKELFLKLINDSSYTIAGNALLALGAIDSITALGKAKILEVEPVKGALSESITKAVYMYSSENEFDTLAAKFDNMPVSYAKHRIVHIFANFLKRVNNTANFKKGIDMIVSFRDSIPLLSQEYAWPYINGTVLKELATLKQSLGMTEQAEYVNSKIPAKPKDQTAFEVTAEILQRYPGEYDNNLETFKVTLKDDKTLNLISTNGSEMELTALTKDKFSVTDMKGYSVEFTVNEKDEVSKMLFLFSGEHVKELKKK